MTQLFVNATEENFAVIEILSWNAKVPRCTLRPQKALASEGRLDVRRIQKLFVTQHTYRPSILTELRCTSYDIVNNLYSVHLYFNHSLLYYIIFIHAYIMSIYFLCKGW
jgi:hypothetical protein